MVLTSAQFQINVGFSYLLIFQLIRNVVSMSIRLLYDGNNILYHILLTLEQRMCLLGCEVYLEHPQQVFV